MKEGDGTGRCDFVIRRPLGSRELNVCFSEFLYLRMADDEDEGCWWWTGTGAFLKDLPAAGCTKGNKKL